MRGSHSTLALTIISSPTSRTRLANATPMGASGADHWRDQDV
jgi:hypothetical protein